MLPRTAKARGARGKVEVHVCRARDVRKPRGMAAGKVSLKRFEVVKAYAVEPPEDARDGTGWGG